MDARMVWDVWRRILRDPDVHERMFDDGYDPTVAGFTPDEAQVVHKYAASPSGTRFFIANYRYRMTRSVFNALETVAPLTRRALHANEFDLDAAARQFLDETHWADHGPYVVTFGAAVLDHLGARPDVVRIPGLLDLIRLERAAADVLRAAAQGDPPAATGRAWRVNPWLRVVDCDTDLSGWLRTTGQLGRTVPPARPRQFGVYLSAADRPRRIVVLPRQAVLLLSQVAEGSLVPDGDDPLLAQLAGAGLVLRAAAEVV
jgi:hypothetical protein